jgi:hypothetical protein
MHVDLVGGTDQRQRSTGAGSVGHHREAHPRREPFLRGFRRPIPMDAKKSTALRSTMTADGWLVCAEASASSNSEAVAMSISPEQLNTTVVSCRRCSTTKSEPAPELSNEVDNKPTSQVSGGGLSRQPVAAAQKAYRGSLQSECPNPAESVAAVRFRRDGDRELR